MTACLVLLCGVFAAKTVARNHVWLSREALFKSGVSTLPHNAKAHYNYANFLKDVGRSAEAVQHYREAVRYENMNEFSSCYGNNYISDCRLSSFCAVCSEGG